MRSSRAEGYDKDTTFWGSKNLEKGMTFKGTFSKKYEKEAEGPGGKFTSITYFLDINNEESVGLSKLGNLQYLMDKKLKVQPGEVVEIEYNGKDANGYHNFDVTVLEELDEAN